MGHRHRREVETFPATENWWEKWLQMMTGPQAAHGTTFLVMKDFKLNKKWRRSRCTDVRVDRTNKDVQSLSSSRAPSHRSRFSYTILPEFSAFNWSEFAPLPVVWYLITEVSVPVILAPRRAQSFPRFPINPRQHKLTLHPSPVPKCAFHTQAMFPLWPLGNSLSHRTAPKCALQPQQARGAQQMLTGRSVLREKCLKSCLAIPGCLRGTNCKINKI